ncbi:MAG TPA: hypothetical protein VFH80_12335 [Solirubrobacteraceae bacterium]|nr:hypothetical protein [Solirubrobacteraceae bacterium]
MSGRDGRGLALIVSLLAVGLVMIAAPICVFLGEKVIVVSPSLWNLALDLCRVITGLVGLFVLGSALSGRGADSSRHDTFGSIVGGVVLIAGAVLGLGLVIVVTGLGGLVFLYAGGALAVDAFRSGHREAAASEPSRHA